MATEFPDPTSLRITRTMAATPERVWEAFTTPEQMARWMWGESPNTTATCDLRIGGRLSVYTDAPEGNTYDWPSDRWGFVGIWVDLVPHERMIYTIHWDGPVGYNQTGDMVVDEAVIVDLVGNGDGTTQLAMWHIGVPADGVSAPAHAEGIEAMMDSLDRVVAG